MQPDKTKDVALPLVRHSLVFLTVRKVGSQLGLGIGSFDLTNG